MKALEGVSRSRSVALTGSLSALAIAFGYLLAPVPNVELMTVTCFLAGFFLGWKQGAAVGGVSMSVYSLLNPRGMALPLVTLAQISGLSLAGCSGALAARTVGRGARVLTAGFLLAGLAVTAVYDLLTNLALGVSLGSVPAVVVAGMAFSVLHIASNAAVFAVAGVSLVKVAERDRSWGRRAG